MPPSPAEPPPRHRDGNGARLPPRREGRGSSRPAPNGPGVASDASAVPNTSLSNGPAPHAGECQAFDGPPGSPPVPPSPAPQKWTTQPTRRRQPADTVSRFPDRAGIAVPTISSAEGSVRPARESLTAPDRVSSRPTTRVLLQTNRRSGATVSGPPCPAERLARGCRATHPSASRPAAAGCVPVRSGR
jgi:hypothetical protein